MQIGSGSHTYEWDEQWGTLPPGRSYGYTHGVVEDAAGRVYIHNASKNSVCVFDKDGNLLSTWGNAYAAGAHGLHLTREKEGEFLYLSTTNQRMVVKLTLEGKVVWAVTTPPQSDVYESDWRLFQPTETAVAVKEGLVFVADGYGQPYVHVYDLKGNYKKSFGGPGNGKGQLSNCHGIMIDRRGKEPFVLVSDRGNSRLQYFDLDGKAVKITGEGIVMKPCTTIQHGDEIYIPDLHSRVTILDKNDKLVCHLGETFEGWKMEGWPNIKHEWRRVGYFTSPHGLHVDPHGNIYVVEWINDGRVTRLNRM
ncbi:MAG: hypothetical protein HY291_20810 [Planctomycetes bacterium]|nr:hypothetical protein [Planctomycetota bacterium]